jgi:prevent-host-death family protein
MQNAVGIFEAKTHFTQIVNQVQRGEEIIITKRGEAVAKIVPINKVHNIEASKAAAVRLQALAKKMQLGKFDWNECKSYRDEGRA